MPDDTVAGRGPADDLERRRIREAMDRLIEGAPLHSDGKLTVKSLAAEAQVKRWVLTHKHPDLQGEFRARIERHGRTPTAFASLVEENEENRARVHELVERMADADETIKRYARVVQVLTLENEHLRQELASTTSKVRPIRRP